MVRVKRNLIANFAGTMWLAVLALACIPFYIQLLGIEAYGLVGFFISLQAVIMLLDLGFGMVLNREIASHPADRSFEAETRELVHTAEILYWLMALVIVLMGVGAAGWLATEWFQPERLSEEHIRYSLVLMGLSLGAYFPYSFYAGSFLGLQRHVDLSATQIIFGTVRWAGVLPVLLLTEPSLPVFFGWHFAVGLAQNLTLAVWLRHVSDIMRGAGVKLRRIVELKGFAAGLAAVTLLGAFLSQIDKLVLSRMASLEEFGFYTVASAIASGLGLFALPFFMTLYPRLSQLAGKEGQGPGTVSLYHRSSQLLAVFVMPAAVMLALFSRDVLLAWTRDSAVADAAAPVLVLLSIGFAMNGIMQLPYALQLAHGWTSLALIQNLVAVVVLPPLTVMTVIRFGAPGAAIPWLLLNLCYVTVGVLFMHRRLLQGEALRWFVSDNGLPLAAALGVGFGSRLLIDRLAPAIPLVLTLALVGLVVLVAAGAASPLGRSELRRMMSQLLG